MIIENKNTAIYIYMCVVFFHTCHLNNQKHIIISSEYGHARIHCNHRDECVTDDLVWQDQIITGVLQSFTNRNRWTEHYNR